MSSIVQALRDLGHLRKNAEVTLAELARPRRLFGEREVSPSCRRKDPRILQRHVKHHLFFYRELRVSRQPHDRDFVLIWRWIVLVIESSLAALPFITAILLALGNI